MISGGPEIIAFIIGIGAGCCRKIGVFAVVLGIFIPHMHFPIAHVHVNTFAELGQEAGDNLFCLLLADASFLHVLFIEGIKVLVRASHRNKFHSAVTQHKHEPNSLRSLLQRFWRILRNTGTHFRHLQQFCPAGSVLFLLSLSQKKVGISLCQYAQCVQTNQHGTVEGCLFFKFLIDCQFG